MTEYRVSSCQVQVSSCQVRVSRGGLTTVHAVHANQAYLLRGPTFLVPFFYRRCRELTRSRNLVVVDSSVAINPAWVCCHGCRPTLRDAWES